MSFAAFHNLREEVSEAVITIYVEPDSNAKDRRVQVL